MFTIREALSLPVFASSTVVAGAVGLDNQINWVHIVDIPEAHYEWQRRGVLLLTAGFGLRDRPDLQANLIPKLVEQGFAGMVLSVGYYFDKTPDVIRETADANRFPVIETPRDVLFIDVTEAILEQIANRQYSLLQRSADIHKQLTDLVLQGGNLDVLAQTLAGLLQRSITIEDPAFRVLTTAQVGSVDEARKRSVENGRTTPEVAEHLLEEGVYDHLLKSMAPMRLPPMPDLGMTMERFVAPIIVDHEIYGYIWIIAGDRPLTELDELVLDRGATVAALILFKEQAVQEAEEARRGDFLEELLRGGSKTAVFLEQARRYNYHPERPHQVLLIHAHPKAGGSGRSFYDDVERWLQQQLAPALLVWRDAFLVLVLESDHYAKGKELATKLVTDLSHPARPLLVGIGKLAQPNVNGADAIRHSFEQAQEAIRISQTLDQQEGVVPFVELGLLHWLYHLPPEQRDSNPYLDHVHKLAAYDAERNADLVQSLEAYLDHGGSLVETADSLFIHRNTLLHRLDRIADLCQLDLRDPHIRLNMHVAVKAYRLFF